MSNVRVPGIGDHPVATYVANVSAVVDLVAVDGPQTLTHGSIPGAADVGGERAAPARDTR